MPPKLTAKVNVIMTISRPLSGKTVLVTRSAGQSSQFRDLLQAQGAAVVEMPALVIRPPRSWQPLDQAIDQLAEFDWLVLTSSNAVNYLVGRLRHHGLDPQQLQRLKLAVVGRKTAKSLEDWGLTPDLIPPNYIADDLVAHFPQSVAGKSLLFPRVESGGRAVLVKELTEAGAKVVEVPAYESGCPDAVDPQVQQALEARQIDIITFASAKTVKHFCQLLAQAFGGGWVEVIQSMTVASIGPQTSVACKQLLGRVDVQAREYTLEGLTQALIDWAKPGLDGS